MKNGSILLMATLMLFLSGCGVYALMDPSPPNPSPTPIGVATLAPPTVTATASLELEPAAPALVGDVQPTATGIASALIAIPTETALPSPTFTAEPDWLAYSGRTEDGLMFLGNPEAPIKMIDFSDFM
jgi:hypothetical protein